MRGDLERHLGRVRLLFDEDRTAEVPGVWLPDALAVKYPAASIEWGWQWVFPSKSLSIDPRSGVPRRAPQSLSLPRGEPATPGPL